MDSNVQHYIFSVLYKSEYQGFCNEIHNIRRRKIENYRKKKIENYQVAKA